MNLNKLLDNVLFKKTEEEEAMEKNPERFKYCPDCNGLGWSDVFVNCDTCEKTGYVRKTYNEYVDSLPTKLKH